jgi:translation initiation factor 1 (eIF-1/SUI1)
MTEATSLIDESMINLFNSVKVFSVNATDNHIKKLDLTAQDAKIAINMIEGINEFQLKLYSLEFQNSQERIFLNKNLNEIDFLFKNDNISKKIEIKINDKTNKFYYTIEFIKNEDYKEFQKCLEYLKEICGVSNNLKSNQVNGISEFFSYDQEMIDLTNDDDFEAVTPKGILFKTLYSQYKMK